MASNLECVGLGVSDGDGLSALIGEALERAELLGEVAGTSVHAWQDPSGARLVVSTQERTVKDLLPSYAGTPGARLAGLHAVNDEVAVAHVVDADGETLTMLAVEVEQRRLLSAGKQPVDAEAAVVALGVDVTVHADEAAFAASDASLLSPGSEPGEPPAHVVEQGHPWPPRMGPESFISYGVFGPPEQAEAYARLHGTVLSAQRRTVALTGGSFVVARVRTVGFEVDLCLAATDAAELPRPGNVIGGTVFLVASVPALAAAAPARRSWLPWRKG
ncbi:hypothetical protein [Catellatospora citrea]|uniref:Uncharacterized protein n=1 Tax=Catellatospora citrea TaxID=53366 RepID=A0A8J3KIX7_9ACTN|nr:hypothetical protein [Catellatospora citrea]RKE10151.1 hypothetical protein C8E86_5045 [Catellatospora citrea]GIF97938.1 hypothetical protein Cci01nite_30320 [Catellatospora citrea]